MYSSLIVWMSTELGFYFRGAADVHHACSDDATVLPADSNGLSTSLLNQGDKPFVHPPTQNHLYDVHCRPCNMSAVIREHDTQKHALTPLRSPPRYSLTFRRNLHRCMRSLLSQGICVSIYTVWPATNLSSHMKQGWPGSLMMSEASALKLLQGQDQA